MSETIRKDFLKREITIGDYIVFPAPWGMGLKLGRITKFTPQNMRVDWSFKSATGKVYQNSSVRKIQECVRVEGEDLTMYLLSGEY